MMRSSTSKFQPLKGSKVTLCQKRIGDALNKLADEPLEIHVNGKLVAQGEVVVIGENFGIRITQILSKEQRVDSLK